MRAASGSMSAMTWWTAGPLGPPAIRGRVDEAGLPARPCLSVRCGNLPLWPENVRHGTTTVPRRLQKGVSVEHTRLV